MQIFFLFSAYVVVHLLILHVFMVFVFPDYMVYLNNYGLKRVGNSIKQNNYVCLQLAQGSRGWYYGLLYDKNIGFLEIFKARLNAYMCSLL